MSSQEEEIERLQQQPWLWLPLLIIFLLLIPLSASLFGKLLLRRRLVLEYALASLLVDG